MNVEQLRDWTPIRIYWRDARPFVDWCCMDGARFVEPFFDQTIEKRFRYPFNLIFRHQTPLEVLGELYEQTRGLPLKGLIFHMSRCGSTLISQMLASLERNVVVSEAGPIDMALRSNFYDPSITEEMRVWWLRWVVAALGQRRNDAEETLFIKTDCWHMIYLPLIERAFPGVPWVFVYRDPVEVMVSHRRRRGGQVIQGVLQSEIFRMNFSEATRMSPDEYCARVLAGICEAALKFSDNENGLLINYNQLPEAMLREIASHFQLKFDDGERDRMRSASRMDAKNPVMTFEDDSVEKQRAATDEVWRLAEQLLEPLYERLEVKRRRQR